jgi:hypothetical protein
MEQIGGAAKVQTNTQPGRLGPLGRVEETPPQAIVLGMHRSGTSALTSLLDRLGFYAGPDDGLMGPDAHNAMGYWELGEVQAFNEELLAALGGSWTDVLEIDPRRLRDLARDGFLRRARSLVGHLNSYGPWVIKDPRLCLLLPFWRDLLERPLCILIHRNPLSVARSLARRDGLPIHAGIALWEHYNRAALAASQGLPRVLVRYRDLIDEPSATASRLVRRLTDYGVRGLEGLRDLSPADARTLLDSSLEHHASAPGEELGYLNAGQRELFQALESGSALLEPVPPLSPGAREILHEHARQARKAAAQRQSVVSLQADLVQGAERERSLTADLQELAERAQRMEATLAGHDAAVAALEHRLAGSQGTCGDLAAELHRKEQTVTERDELLAAVFNSRSWRLGFGLKRLLGILRVRRVPTALDRWESLRDD